MEDGLVRSQTLFCVFDGVSRPTPGLTPPLEFEEKTMSGGEMVVRLAERVCTTNAGIPGRDARTIMRCVNGVIRHAHQELGIRPHETNLLAGTFFAAAEIRGERIRILQTGDCYAVVAMRDGRLRATPNPVRTFSAECKRFQASVMARLFRERGIDPSSAEGAAVLTELRTLMRGEFYEFYLPMRARRVNAPDGWALLNGQPEAEALWHHAEYRRDDVMAVLLFTDGFVGHLVNSCTEEELARIVYDDFTRKGLHGILADTREIERRDAATSTISHAEATAVSIVF